ncbi:polysaccharide deacetylase family protein [Candidatus Woesearchaeota archaeon]|nr:polysaccharide deacetylase family protein [Candidatus Woesearchaeota archaeon]
MIALTIDCEQWNSPYLRGKDVPENNKTSFSKKGNIQLLDIFRKHDIKTTFFVTGYYAERENAQVKEIRQAGHEIASHGYNHHYRGNGEFDIYRDIEKSKRILEKITHKKINGFRAPQLQFSYKLLSCLDKLGFEYDSSLHPTHLSGPRNAGAYPIQIHKPFKDLRIKEVPLAVTPKLRLPMGWLWMRLLGLNWTKIMVKSLLKRGITPNIYIHSWEFTKMKSRYAPPHFNWKTGDKFSSTLSKFIEHFNDQKFVALSELI